MVSDKTTLRILIVDDDPISRAILEDHLAASGHDVFCADSATRAMYMLERAPVHIVLADWVMPELSGIDLCRWVRSRQMARSPHFVMITSFGERDRLVEAFGAGADDFLTKPFHEAELLARLRAWSRLVSLQDALAARQEEATRLATELIDANRRLSELAARDELTGLGNRRAASARLDELLAIANRTGRGLACAAVDIDKFKDINDRHGHAIGDAVLRHVASILSATTDDADAAFRVGGDEFLVVLPGLPPPAAAAWAERFRQAVVTHPYTDATRTINLTVSLGLSARTTADDAAGRLLSAADAALYASKRLGRNAVSVASAVA